MKIALLVLVAALPAFMALSALWPGAHAVIRRLAWLAAVPGLCAAALVPAGFEIVVADVLLGLRLGLAHEARLLLAAASLLWLVAAVHADAYLEPLPRTKRFTCLFLLSMAGNLGVFVAQDAAGFYMAFGVMSLAAYVLVVHDETSRARAAGRIYIWFAMLGEACLLMGLLMAAALAEDLAIAEIRSALAQDGAPVAVTLLVVGFGIKLGLVPLHVWMPWTYAATPPPGAAVLAGAMVNAGVLGLIAFLPLGDATLAAPGLVLAVAGAVTAFYGVAVGLLQREACAVLAYSSSSQLGVLAGGLGVAGLVPDAAPAIVSAVALYAVHHGLAKGGLFLAVGAKQRGVAAGAQHLAFALVVALAALAVGGMPFTSGAVVKHALKEALDVEGVAWRGAVAVTLSLSAAATTALVVHFLRVFLAPALDRPPHPRRAGVLLMTVIATVGLGQALTFAAADGETTAAVLSSKGLVAALWPAALGVSAALVLGRLPLPTLPPGDVLVPLRSALRVCRRRLPPARSSRAVARGPHFRVPALPARDGGSDAQTRIAVAAGLTAIAIVFALTR